MGHGILWGIYPYELCLIAVSNLHLLLLLLLKRPNPTLNLLSWYTTWSSKMWSLEGTVTKNVRKPTMNISIPRSMASMSVCYEMLSFKSFLSVFLILLFNQNLANFADRIELKILSGVMVSNLQKLQNFNPPIETSTYYYHLCWGVWGWYIVVGRVIIPSALLDSIGRAFLVHVVLSRASSSLK